MPIYQYRCESCGVSFERTQRFSEEPLRNCPECTGKVHRVIQPVGIIFKGSGFYVTDNRTNSALLPGKRNNAADSASGSDTEKADSPAPAENKPKTEPAPAPTAAKE
jgi:putative FmdB family regulatory protein